jgi:hypothetical protein
VTVQGQYDNLSDGDQSYAILLGQDNVSVDRRFRYVNPADVALKNLDLTGKGTFYISAASGDTDENGVSTTFTVRLSSAPDDGDSSTTTDNVTISVSSSDESEGKITHIDGISVVAGDNASLVFTASNWDAEQTVTVQGQYDNLSDGDQSYAILLGQDNVSVDRRFRYVNPADVSLKILDLTGKGTFYFSAASGDTDENGVSTTFTVRLSSAPDDGYFFCDYRQC